MVQSMMKAKQMPTEFLGKAMSTTAFILNHTSMKSLKGMTPFEEWYGRKPDVSFLRTFGCVGHVKARKLHLSKLEDRNTPMVLLGYKVGSKVH